jgi:DNA-binding GntR family transcriptional regulator
MRPEVARPIGRRLLRDEIRERLMEDILRGRLKPGTPLAETHVAREFGVSQAPVREAFRDLELLGFLEKSAFRGARVRHISRNEVAEIYPVRAGLEGVAARAAAVRIDEAALQRLEELLEVMREAAAQGDEQQQVEADIAFHETIIEASGNGLLMQLWQAMRLATTTFLTISLAHRPLAELAERHVPLLEALRAKDPDAAEAAMRRHIEQPGEWIRSEMQKESAEEGSSSDPDSISRSAARSN